MPSRLFISMKRMSNGLLLVFTLVTLGAQTAPQPRILGEIASVDAAKKEFSVKAADGSASTVQINEASKLMRIPPGEKDLSKAETIKFEELGVGDRVLVRGGSPATSVIVMTKAAIAKKHEGDRAEWQKRGISGTVIAVNPEAKEITVSASTAEGRKEIVIDSSAAASLRRYAPDSIRFSDAKPSSIAELQKGDQLRALGERDATGLKMKAEEIVFGTFQSIAGTIKEVNAATGELTITNLETKKPVVIKINPDTSTKKIPAMMATMLAMRVRAPAGGAPAGAAPAGAAGGRPGGARGNMDFSAMLERMPALNIAELKQGDAIILSGTRGSDPSKVTAIVVVAGVEPLLTAAPAGSMGSWNFDIGMPTM